MDGSGGELETAGDAGGIEGRDDSAGDPFDSGGGVEAEEPGSPGGGLEGNGGGGDPEEGEEGAAIGTTGASADFICGASSCTCKGKVSLFADVAGIVGVEEGTKAVSGMDRLGSASGGDKGFVFVVKFVL